MTGPSSERTPQPALLAKPLPMVSGAVTGLAATVLLQQYAVAPATPGLLLLMVVLGVAVIGIGLPTLFMHILRRKAEKQTEVAPRAPAAVSSRSASSRLWPSSRSFLSPSAFRPRDPASRDPARP
jgi:hypothetical protein